MYLWKVWKPFQHSHEYIVTHTKNIEEVIKVLNENDYVEPESIEFVTTVLAPKGEVFNERN